MPSSRAQPPNAQELPEFVVGNAYNRREEITGKFGGNWQSGIASSDKTPAIFLFSGVSGEKFGYKDQFESDGCFRYSGEGQVGHMTFTGGNLAVLTHALAGKAIHLFKYTGKGKPYLYLGEFSYGSHEIESGPDREGNLRDIILFRLVPVALAEAFEKRVADESDETVPLPSASDLNTLRAAALAACAGSEQVSAPKDTVRANYYRSEKVRRYVLARASGSCELCHAPAPFQRKDGTPYLEPHHINRVSDGGLDHPRYVGAICPTCHRHIHYGRNGSLENEKLRLIVANKEEQK